MWVDYREQGQEQLRDEVRELKRAGSLRSCVKEDTGEF